ncbi:prohead protease [Clostridium botulinum]|uniref:Prohead protease n=1 Tax=Clostridium botulinum TaxID=1491 RepID=A0A6M0T203_CLOBO|nr:MULTISPECIES: prohead protease [Clostridium]MBD5643189.1 prohead protease [Clostridium botulinum]NFA60822.1 prohead protease [Clostridium botulinum]NFI72505.1 prohead protease [Clostridium sporogenes]NFL73490.1 prohead protease [Clostridium sporogenes]NFM23597.1 prohead protease [Clostridium sporogenes]
MDIKKYLLKVLNSKEIIDMLPDKRVYFLHAVNPDKKLYLEYEIVNEYGVEYSEGNEDYTTYIVQLDIFSTGDYTELENTVKRIMIHNGFNRDMAADLYEKETGLYHCAMRFNISLPMD